MDIHLEENHPIRHVKDGLILTRLSAFVSTGFYSGYLPVAPGTWGSLFALVLFWIIPPFRGPVLMGTILILGTLGVFASTVTASRLGKDPSVVNVDEWIGMWLALLLLSDLGWVWQGAAFIVFRVTDIIKPFPAFESQVLPGGWGIMADDILAALYTVFIICMTYALI